MRKKLRLYVWQGVLTDYSSGMMAVALAFSVDHARELLLAECDYLPQEDLAQEPRIVEEPSAFLVWGGG